MNKPLLNLIIHEAGYLKPLLYTAMMVGLLASGLAVAAKPNNKDHLEDRKKTREAPEALRTKDADDLNNLNSIAAYSLGSCADMFQNELKATGAPASKFTLDVIHPAALTAQLQQLDAKQHIRGWKMYTERMALPAFKCIRTFMRTLMKGHCTLPFLQQTGGKYVVEAASFDGPPIFPNHPYFPTRYTIKFVPPTGSAGAAVMYDLPINQDPAKCDLMNDAQIIAHNTLLSKLPGSTYVGK